MKQSNGIDNHTKLTSACPVLPNKCDNNCQTASLNTESFKVKQPKHTTNNFGLADDYYCTRGFHHIVFSLLVLPTSFFLSILSHNDSNNGYSTDDCSSSLQKSSLWLRLKGIIYAARAHVIALFLSLANTYLQQTNATAESLLLYCTDNSDDYC